jgi:hypothetical protein
MIRDAAYYVDQFHKTTIENVEQLLEANDDKSKATIAKIDGMIFEKDHLAKHKAELEQIRQAHYSELRSFVKNLGLLRAAGYNTLAEATIFIIEDCDKQIEAKITAYEQERVTR